MKAAALADKLAPVLPMLRCPLCGDPFRLDRTQARCAHGHCFDLSSRGYLNLAPSHNQSAEKYGAALFESRNRVFQAGFYRPVLDAVTALLAARFGSSPFSLADVGCGEGYYARALKASFPGAVCFGVDLSRDGIVQAARGGSGVHWLVADLKRLPFAGGSLDTLLDVLTPADYAEFSRVLAPGGELLKVIPGQDYLREVRLAVREHLRSPDFDNRPVLAHLRERAHVLERVEVRRVYRVTEEQSRDFLRMTPMTFSVHEEALEALKLSSVTIHMEVLRCRMRRG